MFGITITRNVAPSATPKKRSRKASTAKTPNTVGVAIKLAMAAVGSILDKGTLVPFVEVTVGDLAQRLDNVVRPNGSVGNHYPAAYAAAEADLVAAQAATDWLLAKGQRPKGTPKPKASDPAPTPAAANELAAVTAELQLLKELIANGGIAAATDHVLAPKERELVVIDPEAHLVGLADEVYEVAIAKNGKPFLRVATA